MKHSGHFRREARLMLGSAIVFLLIVFLIAVVAPRVLPFLAADTCADSGGVYDRELRVCVHDR
ncbi:MAG: hypothetical protein ACREVL_05210 [Solimonas sp.]